MHLFITCTKQKGLDSETVASGSPPQVPDYAILRPSRWMVCRVQLRADAAVAGVDMRRLNIKPVVFTKGVSFPLAFNSYMEELRNKLLEFRLLPPIDGGAGGLIH